MRGRFFITFGLTLIVVGAVVLYFAYEAANGLAAAVAWASIVGGAIALLVGIGQRVGRFMQPENSELTDYAHAEIRVLIQSMGEMAAADGVIDPKEIASIADIHERMLGVRISHDEVAEILSEFHENDDIRSKFAADRKHVNPTIKRMIIQSCYLVMMSDDKVADAEMKRIHEIGQALGFSDAEIDHLVTLAGT